MNKPTKECHGDYCPGKLASKRDCLRCKQIKTCKIDTKLKAKSPLTTKECHGDYRPVKSDNPMVAADTEEGQVKLTWNPGMDEKPANPKQAYGDNKVPIQLVPPVIEIYAALALGEGGDKYGPYNYREIPVEIMTYVGAIKRHLDALLDGEWDDPGYWQDGKWYPPKPHLAGVIASAGIIADCYENGNLIDNRPKPGKANELLKKYQRDNRPGPDSNGESVQQGREDVPSDGHLGEGGSGPVGYCPAPMFEECG